MIRGQKDGAGILTLDGLIQSIRFSRAPLQEDNRLHSQGNVRFADRVAPADL